MGRSERQLRRARQTEAWEIVYREAGRAAVGALAPHAAAALVRSWERGSAADAVEVLRALGFLAALRVEVAQVPGPDRPRRAD